jgi:hypothetical protein
VIGLFAHQYAKGWKLTGSKYKPTMLTIKLLIISMVDMNSLMFQTQQSGEEPNFLMRLATEV